MANALTPEIVALMGIFLGILARSLLPYLRKTIQEGKDLTWDNKYTATAIISAIITLLTFPAFRAATQLTLADPLILFTTAFIYGFFLDVVVIEGFEWLNRPPKTPLTQPSLSTPP